MRACLLALLSALLLSGHGVLADPVPAEPEVRLQPGEAPPTAEALVVRALDRARRQLQPSLGATVYTFSRSAIERVPGGDNAPLDQVLLQAPGVAQDSYGQIHVRGDHNEVQYRLDGVQLPEGLSVFGQALQTRFAHSLSLITGALPAQYGILQAAVVDITTKSGATDPGGEISLYGGARDFLQPSLSYGGQAGPVDYFIEADALHTRVGLENPTSSFNAIHDLSNQYHGLLHLDGLLDPNTRLSLIAGVSHDDFQIPNVPGQPTAGYPVDGVSSVDSASLTEHQREVTDFAILSLQKHLDTVDVRSSVFTRYSSLYYTPDPLGDLLFDGISQTAARAVTSSGAQTDASWAVADRHTIRACFQAQVERNTSSTDSAVLPTDAAGAPTADLPETIQDGSGRTGALYGLYVQDEWRVLPRVTINGGLRFDVLDEYAHGNQASPRLNIVWKATDATTLHVGYARYFTPPPFELVSAGSVGAFNGTTAASEVITDTVVKPERDSYYDAGIDHVLAPGLRVGLDGYFKDAKDLIDEGQFGAPIILSAFNYAQGQAWGLEGSASYDRGPWSAYANVAYSRAIGKDIESAQFNFAASDLAYIADHWIHLDHDQRWSGSGGIAYTAFRRTPDPARLSADLVVGSGLRADGLVPNGRALPGYDTVNLSATQAINTGFVHGLTLRLDVINLLDRRYEIRDGTGVGVGAPQFGLRRTVLAGVAQRF